VSEGQGSWLEYIEFDGKTYWTIDEELPQWKLVNDDRVSDDKKQCLLESDSYLRIDHEHLRLKDYAASDKEKDELEQQQRRDKKSREAAESRRKSTKK